MYRKLTDQEIKLVLEKVRQKYKVLIEKFHKPPGIARSFEERYMKTLKSKMDLSVFLLAEIEAVDEIYNQEIEKQKKLQEDSNLKKQSSKSFADKVMEENEKKIAKYPKVNLSNDADDEVEKLFGSIRILILNFWPVISQIFKNEPNYPAKRKLGDYYHALLTKYDYKGEVPISKSYVNALNIIPKNSKKIDYERQFIIKETAFLLNEMLDEMKIIFGQNDIPNPENKLNFNGSSSQFLKDNFNNLTHREGYMKVTDYLANVILDFRIKDLKKTGTANY